MGATRVTVDRGIGWTTNEADRQRGQLVQYFYISLGDITKENLACERAGGQFFVLFFSSERVCLGFHTVILWNPGWIAGLVYRAYRVSWFRAPYFVAVPCRWLDLGARPFALCKVVYVLIVYPSS